MREIIHLRHDKLFPLDVRDFGRKENTKGKFVADAAALQDKEYKDITTVKVKKSPIIALEG